MEKTLIQEINEMRQLMAQHKEGKITHKELKARLVPYKESSKKAARLLREAKESE